VLNDIRPEVSGFEAESQYFYKYYKEKEEEIKKTKRLNLSRLLKRKKRLIKIRPSKKDEEISEKKSEYEDLLDITDSS